MGRTAHHNQEARDLCRVLLAFRNNNNDETTRKKSTQISMKTSRLLLVLFVLGGIPANCSAYHYSKHHTSDAKSSSLLLQPQDMAWHLCPAPKRNHTRHRNGELLSKFGPFLHDCLPAKVPSTVLSILLDNGVYDIVDSYYETELDSIPDIYDTGSEKWTYYYVAEFQLLEDKTKQHALLELRSINYKAELWLDGSRVVPGNQFPNVPDPESVQGMFQRFQFPLGQLSQGSSNVHHLAILVHPPPHPGKPGGGQGGSTHELAQDGPVSQFTAGWDWIQATPDRNTGLWDLVTIQQIGRLHLKDPFVRVHKVKVKERQADLEFGVQIDCWEALAEDSKSITIIQLDYHVLNSLDKNGHGIQTRYLNLYGGATCNKSTSRFPVERLNNAQLWYPHTHGNPTLYEATIRVGTFSHNESFPIKDPSTVTWEDQVSFQFGIRKVDFSVVKNPKLNGLQATINDERVFLQGGNWIATDQLMRFIGDKGRYLAEIALHKAMGFNMIRVWGGGITERPEFFEICDRLGILVLSDLWMTGDNNGRWAGSYSWPLNRSLYLNSIQDTFLLLRNHPSLAMYSVGNELYPIEKNPSPDILSGIRQALREIDPGTFLIASTMTNWTDFDPEQSLCPKDGPYGVMEEAFYYERNPGLYDWKDDEHFRLLEVPIAFQPEIGSASFPTFASLCRFMSIESLNAFPGFQDSKVHPTWQYHNFLGFTSHRDPYAKDPVNDVKVDLIYQYGAPANISEYTIRAQLVQFTQFRTLFESYRSKMFEWYTAVLFWKSQSPWPSLRGGLYDWFLGMTGGYYGVRAALSGTQSASLGDTKVQSWVHAQMNLLDHSIAVVTSPNTAPSTGMTIGVQVNAFNLAGCQSGQLLYSKTMQVSTKPNAAIPIPNSTVPFVGGDGGVTLYRITAGASISEYWLSNWTPSSFSPSSNSSTINANIPVQDLSSLGKWREDTARHVDLDVSAMYCGYCHNDCDTGIAQSYSICQSAGCSHSEIAVSLTNPLPTVSKMEWNCGKETIAFAVWTELHSTSSTEETKDTRILPTLYSNGLFSILRNETRYVCMDPSLGQNGSSEISKLKVHVSGWNIQDVIVPVQETQARDTVIDSL